MDVAMSAMQAHSDFLWAALLGLAAHLLFFIRGEWHTRAPMVLRFYICCLVLIAFFRYRKYEENVLQCLVSSASVLLCHLSILLGSMLLYRGFFHPLRHFPGPYLAKFSKLWHVWHCRNSKNHLLLDRLGQEYGDFVRTGPNELTIFHPDGIIATSKTEYAERGDFWDLIYPALALITVRDQRLHDWRREVWKPAFTPNAMRGYEPRIRKYATKIEEFIRKEAASGPIDMNAASHRLSYNVMRDLAFGQEADDDDQEWQAALNTITRGLSIFGPVTPAPWITHVALSFTALGPVRDWYNLMAYCRSKLAERIAMEETSAEKITTATATPETHLHRDVISWLIEDARKRGKITSPEEMRWLNGDAFGIVLAGSDTTASSLIFAFWQLARNPKYQDRIYDELMATQSQAATAADAQLSHLDFREFERLTFLNALINETLRLHHPVPTLTNRVVRERGLVVGGHFIPLGTNVVTPRWSLMRRESTCTRACEFLPERWIGIDDNDGSNALAPDSRIFMPFASGKWTCPGKPIALFNMRYTIALLVRNFTFSLQAGDDGSSVIRDYKDQISAHPGPLSLVFTPRNN